jgi:hypothetical protein
MDMKKLLLSIVLVVVVANVSATNYYWVGGVGTSGSPNDWNTGSNWSTTSGGTGGSVVPGSSDVAIFDASSGNVSPFVSINDYTITLSGLQIAPPSTGATANNVVSFIGTATSFTISGNLTINQYKPGTTAYNGNITDYGNNTFSVGGNIATNMATSFVLVSASSTNANTTAGKIALTGLTPTLAFGATGGNLNLQSLDISGTTTATFNSTANALGINGNLNIQAGGKLSITKTLVLNNLTVSGSNPFNSQGTISGDGYITGSTSTQINITGTLPSTYTSSNLQSIGTINFDPATAATSTINSMTMSRDNAVINIGNCLNNLLTIQGGFNISKGTIDDGGKTLKCAGATILTTGGATAIIKGTGKIQCNRANASQALCTPGGTFTVGNLEVINANTGVYYTLGSGTNLTINGTLTLSTPTTRTSGIDASGATLTFQNGNTPIVINQIGTAVNRIKTDASTNLKFGSTGNTGGNAFTIPNDVFTTAPSIASFTVNRDNTLTFNNQTLTVSGATTITAGTLAMASTLTANGAVTVNGTFQLNSGGWATGSGTWTYGAAGTLAFNSTYGVDNSHVYWPTTNGPVNVSVLTGLLTLNSGANRTVNGLFLTAGGVAFPSATLTLNGTAQINAGGYFSNAPTYGSSSILKYNSGTTYGRATEWNTTNPASLQLSNNTTLNYPNGSVVAAKTLTGNLTIDAGSAFYMDYGSPGQNNPLTVNGNVSIAGNMSLGDAVGGDLNVGGNWSHTAGTLNTNNRAITFNGSGAQAINSAKDAFAYLTVNNSAGAVLTMNDNVTVNNNLTVNAASALTLVSAKSLDITGNFEINSNTNGTGTFVNQNASGGFTSGSTSVKQYISSTQTGSNGRNWYISSPLSAATSSTITSATGNSLVYWNGSAWTNAGSTMDVMKGYIAVSPAQNTTINFTGGTLNSGDKSVSDLPLGFNLVGNPYPSYVDFDQATKTNVAGSIWYRSKKDGSYNFHTYNVVGGISVHDGTAIIPPMQSFWIKTTSATNTFGFTNAMRSHQDQSVASNRLKLPASSNRRLVRLQVSNSINSDETVIYFNPGALNTLDDYDSQKMFNNNVATPEIYTIEGNERLVINGLNSSDLNNNVTLGFMPGQSGNFSIKATEVVDFDPDSRVYLRDNTNGTETLLQSETTYQFTSDATNTDTRFSVIFRSSSGTTGINEMNNLPAARVFSNESGYIVVEALNIDSPSGKVQVYNTCGQKLYSGQIYVNNQVIDQKFPAGIYIVNLISNGKISSSKLTIK